MPGGGVGCRCLDSRRNTTTVEVGPDGPADAFGDISMKTSPNDGSGIGGARVSEHSFREYLHGDGGGGGGAAGSAAVASPLTRDSHGSSRLANGLANRISFFAIGAAGGDGKGTSGGRSSGGGPVFSYENALGLALGRGSLGARGPNTTQPTAGHSDRRMKRETPAPAFDRSSVASETTDV